MIIKLINIVILLIFPFIFIGIINKTKAFWAGRKGSSIFQPFYDFTRLMKKGTVLSNTTSEIFQISPTITFASIILAGLFVPIIKNVSLISFEGSFIIFAYIIALGKFFSLIGSMDTGSSFEGMGASREASFSTIVEPAFFLIMASLVALTGNYTFQSLSMILHKAGTSGILVIALSVLSLFVLLLVEGCRIPVDDPNTHLELTMIHEVMILDNSGVDLALILYGSAMKMFIYASVIISLIIPVNMSLLASLVGYTSTITVLAIILGTLESATARIRMSHVFAFIFISTSLALIVFSLVLIKIYGN